MPGEIILIAILLIEIMAVFVLYYKMRKQRRKIKRKTEKARGVAYRDSAKVTLNFTLVLFG